MEMEDLLFYISRRFRSLTILLHRTQAFAFSIHIHSPLQLSLCTYLLFGTIRSSFLTS